MKRSEIIAHYKSFFGLEDMPIGENDNLMIGWAQTLLEDVKKAEGVDPWTASHVVEPMHGKTIVVVGPSGHAAAATVEVIKAINAGNGEIIECIPACPTDVLPVVSDRRFGDDVSLTLTARNIDFNDLYIPKTKRTNHERQPASFGKGKNKRRK